MLVSTTTQWANLNASLQKLEKENSMSMYSVFAALNPLNQGDKVKVIGSLAGIDSPIFGWRNSWIDDMDQEVGRTLTVEFDGGDEGVILKESSFHFPHFLLEKIEVPKTSPILTGIRDYLEVVEDEKILKEVINLKDFQDGVCDLLEIGTDLTDITEEIDRLREVDLKMENIDLDKMEKVVSKAISYIDDAINSLQYASGDLNDLEL
jgi:hypothetical protein